MNYPLASIIIPCFNAEAFVGEAIESALAQTYPNIEVIVVDDGSLDGSFEVIRAFGNRIRSQRTLNLGGGAARNLGLSLAEGQIIQFLDADDILYPEKLSRMLSVSDLRPNEILFADFMIVEPGTGSSYISPRPEEEACGFRYLLEAERLQTSSPLYPRSSLLHVGGFDVSLPCAQEYDLNLRLSLHGWLFRRFPEILHEVRCRPRSVSSDYARVLRQHETIFLKLLEENKQIFMTRRNLKKQLAWRFVRNARLLSNLGDVDGARQAAFRAKQLGMLSGIRQGFSWKSWGIAYVLGPVRAERLIQRIALFAKNYIPFWCVQRSV